MPALMAVISGTSEPLQRELKIVQRMAAQTTTSLSNMGSGGHVGQSGIIRETLVLMREISRGNFTRVPGSLSILLQRMGILNLILRDSSSASKVLAAAWEEQAAAASLSAVAATRKAQASLAAFDADVENTEATLAQAVADEAGAAAAISNARATQAKAVAAAEAAQAQSAGAALSIGPLGVAAGVVLALAAGAYIAYQQIKAMGEALGGLAVKGFNPDYIGQKNKATNRPAEEQKQINEEIRKSIELYNSASKAAGRVADATKSHFDHLRKMNSFERDPAKRAAKELEINKEERLQELSNKANEKFGLEQESKEKQRQAEAIRVSSKEHDENLLKEKKEAADEAQKFLDTGTAKTFGNALLAANPLSGVSADDINKAFEAKKAEARQRIKDYNSTKDEVDKNEDLRKKRAELIKQAGSSAAAAAQSGLSIPEFERKFKQANKDEAEESAAQLANEKGKIRHGHVSNLQQVGAYTFAGEHVTIARQQLHHLANIDRHISTGGHGIAVAAAGRVQY